MTSTYIRQDIIKINILRRAIYLASLFNVASTYRTLEFVSINPEAAKFLGVANFPFLFMERIAPNSVSLMFVYCIFLGFLILRGSSARPLTMIVIFLTFILNTFAIPVLDGGNNLLFLMLIYLLIPNEAKREKYEKYLVNAFFVLSYFQISIMYFTSSIYKIQTQAWVNGEALFNTLMSIEYSTPVVSKIAWALPPDIFVLSNYMVILFQLTFFIGIITAKTRGLYLLFGVLMHFGIGLLIGLPTFALSVLVCYIQFLPAELFNGKTMHEKLNWLLTNKMKARYKLSGLD